MGLPVAHFSSKLWLSRWRFLNLSRSMFICSWFHSTAFSTTQLPALYLQWRARPLRNVYVHEPHPAVVFLVGGLVYGMAFELINLVCHSCLRSMLLCRRSRHRLFGQLQMRRISWLVRVLFCLSDGLEYQWCPAGNFLIVGNDLWNKITYNFNLLF